MENTNEQVEAKIRKMVNNYADRSPYKLNPDKKVVERIIKGLVLRKNKFGYAYCPCRLVMGDVEKDRKIICPCSYHAEEIERDGKCHCDLFVSADYQIQNKKEENDV